MTRFSCASSGFGCFLVIQVICCKRCPNLCFGLEDSSGPKLSALPSAPPIPNPTLANSGGSSEGPKPNPAPDSPPDSSAVGAGGGDGGGGGAVVGAAVVGGGGGAVVRGGGGVEGGIGAWVAGAGC